jgi:hypothetical protein
VSPVSNKDLYMTALSTLPARLNAACLITGQANAMAPADDSVGMSSVRRALRSSRHAAVAAVVGATAAIAVAMTVAPSEAHAQEVVSSTAKGIVGGAILGGEVVMITESLVGVKPTWAYLLGGGLGAAGGGVAGYFIEQSSSDGAVPSYMLAGGLILSIPTLVLTLNATRYVPTENAREDRAPTNLPPADAGVPGGTAITPGPGVNPAPAPAVDAPAAAKPLPTSMFNLRDGAFRLSIPVPEVRQVFSMTERRQFNMKQETELRVPVLHVSF